MGVTFESLQAWLSKTENIYIDICGWSYCVGTDGDPMGGSIGFDGFIKPVLCMGYKVSALGAINFVDGRSKQNFSGHPLFLAGEIRLNEVMDNQGDPFITIDLRLDQQYHNLFWKSLVLGSCSRDKSTSSLHVKLKHLTPADWEQLRNSGHGDYRGRAAVQPDSVLWSVNMLGQQPELTN